MTIDYSKGKIYKISSTSTPELIYIGSTVQPLCERFAGHNRSYKHYIKDKNATRRITSFDIIKIGDAYIELIEPFPCASKEELTAREAYHIKSMQCCNKVIPGRTWNEYYLDNKDELLRKGKEYKDSIKDTPEFKENKKESDARYRINNLEKIQEYDRTEKRKEASNQRRKVKITCECGKEIATGGIATHKRTQKHIEFEAKQV